MRISKIIDNYEASEPTEPANVRVGDRIATGWCSADTVLDVRPTGVGANAYLVLDGLSGPYTIHCRSHLHVVKD